METRTNLIRIYDELGIDPEANLNNQIDSLDFVSLIIEIEEVFEITLPDELLYIESLTTDNLISIIDKEIEKQNVI